MTHDLSENFIEKVMKPDDYYDTNRKGAGLALRVAASGRKTFTFKYRTAVGTQRRMTLGTWPQMTLAEARRRVADYRAKVALKLDPAAERDARKSEATVQELIEEYRERHAKNYKQLSTLHREENYLQHLPHSWLSKPISSITQADIQSEHRKITKASGPYSANHLMRLFRHMYAKAFEWKLFTGENPVKGLRFNEEAKRERFLSFEEIAAVNRELLAERDWRWRAYFPLTLRFGTRRGELLRAEWKHVDFQRRIFNIPVTKNRKPHQIPFDDGIEALLRELPSFGTSPWVFPSPESATGHLVSPSEAWQRIRERAACPDVRIHDLRHSFASHARLAGFDLMAVKEALNHKSIATTERYTHVSKEERRSAGTATARAMGFLEIPRPTLLEDDEHEAYDAMAHFGLGGEDREDASRLAAQHFGL
jgi:integrase